MKSIAFCFLIMFTTTATAFGEHVNLTVLDSDEKPIAGARIIVMDARESKETKTDEHGIAKITNEPKAGTFLFVQSDSYRFHGEILSSSNDKTLKLISRAQPSGQPMRGKDWELEPDARMALTMDLIDPLLEHVLKQEDDREKLRPLESLAQIAPARTLEILESKPFKSQQFSNHVRARAVEGMAASDPDSALEIAESMTDSYGRVYAITEVVRRATQMPASEKRELLVRAAGDAKSVKNPGQRILMLATVAGALIEIGELDGAKKILTESKDEAEQLPSDSWASFARGSFAEKLAFFDMESAIPLISDLAKHDAKNRHFGNTAHLLASHRPPDAESTLQMIEGQVTTFVIATYDQYAPRVCYHMANVDLARAISIAKSCREVNLQAYSLGVIAHRLGPDKRKQATELLDEAFGLLESGIRDSTKVKIQAASVAGALLPSVEHVDPSLVREFFWRSVCLRTARSDDTRYSNWSDDLNAYHAAWLSRYDRQVAMIVLEHWHRGLHQPFTRDDFATALCLAAPAKAVEFAKKQDKPDQPSTVRLSVAKRLLLHGSGRIRVPHQMCGLWPIGAVDHRW